MKNKTLISFGVITLVALSLIFIYSNSEPSLEGQVILIGEIAPELTPSPEPTPIPEPFPEPTPTPTIKEFSITAKRFEFIPETITVNQGDQVKLTVTSSDVTHGFSIAEYKISERIEPGQEKIIEFTATKKGEFPIVCNVPCGSGHSSMRGKLIVN